MKALVHFVNTECNLVVSPDVENYQDLTDEELSIFNHQIQQRATPQFGRNSKRNEINIRDLRKFDQHIEIQKLDSKNKVQLKMLSTDLNDVYKIF